MCSIIKCIRWLTFSIKQLKQYKVSEHSPPPLHFLKILIKNKEKGARDYLLPSTQFNLTKARKFEKICPQPYSLHLFQNKSVWVVRSTNHFVGNRRQPTVNRWKRLRIPRFRLYRGMQILCYIFDANCCAFWKVIICAVIKKYVYCQGSKGIW